MPPAMLPPMLSARFAHFCVIVMCDSTSFTRVAVSSVWSQNVLPLPSSAELHMK